MRDFRAITVDQDSTILNKLGSLQSKWEAFAVHQDSRSDLVLSRVEQNTSALNKFQNQEIFQKNRLSTCIKRATNQQATFLHQSHQFQTAAHDNLQLHLKEIQGQLADVMISSATYQSSIRGIEAAIQNLQHAPQSHGHGYDDANKTHAVRSNSLFPTPHRTDSQIDNRFRNSLQRMLDFSTSEGFHGHLTRSLPLHITTILSHLEVIGPFTLPEYCEQRRSNVLDILGQVRSQLQTSRRLVIEDFKSKTCPLAIFRETLIGL